MLVNVAAQADASEQLKFIQDVVDSLGFAKQAREEVVSRIEPAVSAMESGNTQKFLIEFMQGTKFGIAALFDAVIEIEEHNQSENLQISGSAKMILLAYGALHSSYKASINMMHELNEPRTAEEMTAINPADLAERQAELAVEHDQAWELLAQAVALSTHGMLEGEDGDKRLAMTSQQRDALIRDIERRFPETRKGFDSVEFAIDVAAAGIRHVLIQTPTRDGGPVRIPKELGVLSGSGSIVGTEYSSSETIKQVIVDCAACGARINMTKIRSARVECAVCRNVVRRDTAEGQYVTDR